jgi:hypothetical protein
MKTENVSELVRAAQRAGAAGDESKDFWSQVEDYLNAKDAARAALVKPRSLTDALNLPTV